MNLASKCAIVLKFQAAVAEYDEETAMSFISQNAAVYWINSTTEQTFDGIDEIREAYRKYWFSVPSQMIHLVKARISTEDDLIKYVFKGVFVINDEKQERHSTSTFLIADDGKIVQINRYSKL